MEVLKFSIAAGEVKRFEKAGRYVEVIAADAALSMFFFDGDGGQVDDAQGIVSGMFVEESFRALTVYSAAAQSITLLLSDGRGGSRRQPGEVAIIDKIGEGTQLYSANITAVGFNVVELIAASANVNGLMIRSAKTSTQAGAGGQSLARLQVAKTQPAVANPTGVPLCVVMETFSAAAGIYSEAANFQLQRRVPPGWGLYASNSVSTAAATVGNMTASVEVL